MSGTYEKAHADEDTVSEFGGDLYGNVDVGASQEAPASGTTAPTAESSLKALHRKVATNVGRGWGKGPIPVDVRKFKYDVNRGKASPALPFSVSKVDRMDAAEAGKVLHEIHEMYGISMVEEARLLAFDRALFFEHTLNGASLLQANRGSLTIDGMSFDIIMLKRKLGEQQRRFFRAFADDIAALNKEILDTYDAYDPESADKVGQLHQIAAERNLQKYPHLVHDSADACVHITYDERAAIMASKALVLNSTANLVDAPFASRPRPVPVNQVSPVGGS